MPDIKQLVTEMTLDEKISLLAGKDMWHTVPLPRLNIPSIKVSDGPNGVRGAQRDNGPASVCLPVGTALGATWNVALIERLGKLLAQELKLKGAHILLAPTVNIHRTPIAGRNFECFSEDPYLTGQMAAAYINGIQRSGAGACIKHFVANDQEFERNSMSSEVAERPLREIYLEPFRLAMRAARPWTVMSAYTTVNIHRTPIAGRNFECFSEDPYLTGQMAAAYINGIQRSGAGACIKHFVANDQEFERNSMSSEVAERPLREIYLEPFRLAMRAARPWTVMSAYNKVNGTFASENDTTLKQILKDEWAFDGFVMSDWFGTYTADVPAGGLDLEMPGPARWMGAEYVKKALESGDLTIEALDDKVLRILRIVQRAGAFDQPQPAQERGEDRPEHRALLRAAAGETIVLLSNKQILPLDERKLKSIGVIGELARWPTIMGGGSSQVNPHPVISPLEGIRSRAGDQIDVAFEAGCFLHKNLPMPDAETLTTAAGETGVKLAIYDNLDFAGEPAFTQISSRPDFGWFGESVPNVNQERFTAVISGFFTAQETGIHTLELASVGQSRLFIDGELKIDGWDMTIQAVKETLQIKMNAGQAYALKVEFCWQGDPRWRSVRLGLLPPQSDDLIADAVALAKRSDVVILVAGLTDQWETEGADRVNMDLPGAQNGLIEQVAAANPNTIVVLNAGSAVTMPWLDKVAAVVEQWYNGLECGNALADVLFGDVCPSGKLPTTFPKRLQDNPAYINYPGENGKVLYGEGLFVGYRYYEKKDVQPLFPFGHGLSYTSFAYGRLQHSAQQFSAQEGLVVTCEVSNTGPVAGKEIVQLYVRDVQASLVRPEKELKAFTKVALEPGETTTVSFELDQEAFWFYNPAGGGWQTEAGEFEILIGASSEDIRLRKTVSLVLEGDGKN